MAVKMKTVITMRAKGACLSHARTDVSVGGHTVVIDEPEVRGGTNLSASPTETLMASLIGCTNVIGHKVAKMHEVDVQEMSVDLTAQFDRRGVILEEEVDIPFPEVNLKIHLTTDADDSKIELIKRDLPRFCPVSKVIRESGTVINEEWSITRP